MTSTHPLLAYSHVGLLPAPINAWPLGASGHKGQAVIYNSALPAVPKMLRTVLLSPNSSGRPYTWQPIHG
jgi:hypothetical protein